jgi:hypothetical protein
MLKTSGLCTSTSTPKFSLFFSTSPSNVKNFARGGERTYDEKVDLKVSF